MRVIDRVAIPTLIVTAADDPFVPPDPFRDAKVAGNRHITTIITPHGGHCGFVGEPTDRVPQADPAHGRGANGYDGYWAERVVVDFIERAVTCPARA
jgi:predicted alpha/beta-fold hydrolase